MILFSVILSACTGFCIAFQGPTNAALSKRIGNFQASTISFGGGTLLLLLASLLVGDGSAAEALHVPPWQLLGGLYGGYAVLIITFASPVLGMALTLTITMLGQIVTGMLIDTFGWFLMDKSPVSPLRMAGCLLVAAGILLVYLGKRHQGDKSERLSSKALLLGILTFFAGVAGAVQAPTNTALSVVTGKFEASFVSFLGGFLLLLVVTLVKGRGCFGEVRGRDIRPWMTIGGAYGAFVVFCNTVATPYIGVALVLASAMLGQLVSAMAIDNRGLMQAPKIKTNRERLAGVAVIAAGVVLVTMARLGV